MVRASRALAGALAIAAIAAATRGAIAGCEYYTNCGACVADTSCGWCGHDPHSQGGYGDVNAGDHVSGLVSGVPTLVGGEGRYSASGAVVTGVNTRFTQQFHGGTKSGAKFYDIANTAVHEVLAVHSDTSMTLATTTTTVSAGSEVAFGVAARTGTGTLAASSTTTARPNSATTEALTIDGNTTEFLQELKVGYWIVVYKANDVVDYRVITAIASETSLTVDYDITGFLTGLVSWGYVSCPPRIGKRNVGLGTIETYHSQDISSAVHDTAVIAENTKLASETPYEDAGHLSDASGSATMSSHRIHGRGTRFESQMGASSTWAAKYHKSGPWMSVQINGDWETVRVKEIGTTTTFAEYIMVLHNSFSEPLLKATHWEWFPMLTKGYGTVRSYGKRVVSNSWDNKELFEDIDGTAPSAPGSLSSQGTYGDTRFLTQLRTGYTITACGQTRMVNSIQSDVELTIDRPFTLGNREFVKKASGTGTATITTLHVRGLTRLLPLWPRGVTVQLVHVLGTNTASPGTYSYTTYWKNFANSGGDAGAYHTAWVELQDTGVSSGIGVYVKWDASATVDVGSEWRLHVADIENCRYYISTEGERYMTDDNANPPICYNHGKCVPANVGDSNRPAKALTQTGGFTLTHSAGTLAGVGSKFLTELQLGDIVRDANAVDARVTAITDDTTATVVSIDTSANAYSGNDVKVLKCAGGRFGDGGGGGSGVHDDTTTIVADDNAGAYLRHPLQTFYQTWSHKYCEIDPGCCGFRVSSVVDPQQYAYYYLKPDMGDYDFRIAVHTVNDNLDLYTTVGTTRPTTGSYGHTSVRESVPWALSVGESLVLCAGPDTGEASSGELKQAVLGGYTTDNAKSAFAYARALGHYIHNDKSPNCDQLTIGIMGDNRYPQTVGASEYSARFYMEFDFPNFACDDSFVEDRLGSAWGGNETWINNCIQHNLRFAGDASVVKNNDASPKYVVRLTEAFARTNGNSALGSPWKSSADFRTSQRVGAVWWHRKVHIWDGFETNFEFQITNPTQCGGADQICDGADGFAFVISNDDRQETVDSVHGNTGWACTFDDASNPQPISGTRYKLCGASGSLTDGGGFVGCPGDGLGYGESTQVDSADYDGTPDMCTNGLKKSLAVEFDTFYNVERRDPKQGKQHWWINATEYVSYNDNHLGVFMTTAPFYDNQPWGSSVTDLKADHSDDSEGMHFGSTPSVPTMADGLAHTVKIRYTRGFTTEKAGTGQIKTTHTDGSTDRRKLVGSSTKFKTELRTGFEFGYGGRVKANVKVKINRDKTLDSARQAVVSTAGPVATAGFADDGEATRVISITSDTEAQLENTGTATSPDRQSFFDIQQPAFDPKQDSNINYNIIKEFPGEIQVFIDDMDRYVFQVAVEDRDMAKILDTDGNAYIGLTASTGSKGFAKVGYQAAEVHQTMDVLSWGYCASPGCVPY